MRERVNFWLDLEKDDQFEVADMVFELKRQRAFSKTVRNGLRLMMDLQAGRVNVLLELFPDVVDAIAEQGRALPPGDPALPDPADDPLYAGHRIAHAPIDAPTFDEDDTALVPRSKAPSVNAGQNFLTNVFQFQEATNDDPR